MRPICPRGSVLAPIAVLGIALGAAAQQKEVFLAPDDHTDYFWTADDADYRGFFGVMIDYYLNLADQTDNRPSDFQSRWNLDGSLWFWEYERTRPQAQVDRLVSRLRSGHFSMPLNPLVVSLGGAPAEAVLRGMYYAGRLERRYNLRFPMAVTMENQTQPLGLAQLWAGSGARYSWKGVCACATRVPDAGARDREIYRYTGTDGSSVVMKWNSQTVSNQALGGYAEARFPAEVTDYVTVNAASNGFAARYPWNVIGAFGYGWDDALTTSSVFVDTVPGLVTPARRVRISNQLDFFERFEQVHGFDALPSESLSYGNEWDLHCASLAETSSRIKRAVTRLRPAEAMAAIVCRNQPGFMTGRESARDLAFMNLGLYWEHNFGMDDRSPAQVAARTAWQNRLADQIDAYVDDLHADALATLGSQIPAQPGTTRFAAFNPLSWDRTDPVDLPYAGPQAVHVVDLSSGRIVASQVIDGATDPTVRGRVLRVLAEGVPSVGYRVYEIRPGAMTFPPAATTSADANGITVQSSLVRARVLKSGILPSVIDLSRATELVDASAGRGINDPGGPLNTGSITIDSAGPVSVTLHTSASSPLARESWITVYPHSPRVDIANRINQNFEATQTWQFPFAVVRPVTHHEEVGAVLTAKLAPQGGHYATRAARYDWLTLNHFADLSTDGQGAGVTLSNADCYFMRLGTSSTTSLDSGSSRITVLAGGRQLGSDFGLTGQGGAQSFLQRFSVKPHATYSQTGAMRSALEHQTPLVAVPVSGPASAPLDPTSESFLRLDSPDAILWSLKPSEDAPGASIAVRVWNMASQPGVVTVSSPVWPVSSFGLTTHLESAFSSRAFSAAGAPLSLNAQQMATARLDVRPSWDVNADGRVDVDDLYAQFAAPADLNADGRIDAYDRDGLVAAVRRAETVRNASGRR